MEEFNVWKIGRDSRTQQIMSWTPHVCPTEKISRIISTPAAGWLSIGFSAFAAVASIFNVFQIVEQQELLERIDRKLNLINRKLNYVINSLDQLKWLTQKVLDNTLKTNQLLYIKYVFDGARINFGNKLKSGEVSLDSLKGLIGDIEMTMKEVDYTNTESDISIPNWMIEQANPVFSFIKILNIFLVECHNRFNEYDPMHVQRYESIDEFPSFLREKVLEEVKQTPGELLTMATKNVGKKTSNKTKELAMFVENVSNEMSRKAPDGVLEKSDDNQDSKLLLDDLYKIWSRYKSTSDQQPRLKWLNAFLWETKLLLFTYYCSPVLSLDNAPILIPSIDAPLLQELMRYKAEGVSLPSQ